MENQPQLSATINQWAPRLRSNSQVSDVQASAKITTPVPNGASDSLAKSLKADQQRIEQEEQKLKTP
ncbi:hypothetical protein PRZ48_003093 [Zasmidium cellare]|uniref:Uncharacterized protein n=1 Tax=Zasmidium cellare TaxID=395010 RepID=A0ABR0EUK3_ZASCE|nr:hypothetical protein PRZ48_003093 [Zasmidium cellare]